MRLQTSEHETVLVLYHVPHPSHGNIYDKTSGFINISAGGRNAYVIGLEVVAYQTT